VISSFLFNFTLFFAGFEQDDDDFTADASSRTPDVVIFSDPRTKSTTSIVTTKAQKKAFMVGSLPMSFIRAFTYFDLKSSKVSKLTETIQGASEIMKLNEDVDDER